MKKMMVIREIKNATVDQMKIISCQRVRIGRHIKARTQSRRYKGHSKKKGNWNKSGGKGGEEELMCLIIVKMIIKIVIDTEQP